MTLLIIMLVVVQMVGLLTILRFNSKIKKVESDNKDLKEGVIKTEASKPVWEEIGLTEKEYNDTRNLVYAIESPILPLYIPGLDDVVETQTHTQTTVNEQQVVEDEFEQPVQPQKSELSELLGIEDVNELEALQKQIELGQQPTPQSPQQSETATTTDIFEIESSTTNVEQDLESIMNEIENQAEQAPFPTPPIEEPQFEVEEQTKIFTDDNTVVKVAPVGEALSLFDEIAKSINEEEKDAPVLFSDNDMHTPAFVIQEEVIVPILPSDEDAPSFEAEEYGTIEQNRMIQILNLLDTESARMNNEFDITGELDEKTLAKQEIATELALLTKEEGTNNMCEIVQLLNQLYELEGKTDDMKSLREEYKEYFEKNDSIPIKIYEEDIIWTDQTKVEETFEIPEKYLWMASAKIADGIQGKQRWLGKVIGLGSGGDVSFIHFRDVSQRIWINVSTLDMSTIEKGDLLTIFIDRNGDNIVAEDVQPIKKALV